MGKKVAVVADVTKKSKMSPKPKKSEDSPIKNPKKKRQNGTDEKENVGIVATPAKKRKMTGDDGNQNDEKDDELNKKLQTSSINKAIFGIFKKLQEPNVNKNAARHINEMIALLTDESNADMRISTCAYALKRLVRCTGADDMDAVALNASYINSIVSQVSGLNPIELLNVLKRELKVNSQQKGKEESLAGVGHLITAFAIIKSPYFETPAPDLVDAIYPILVAHLKGREYLVAMSIDIMAESFKQVDADIFESHVWPLLQPKLSASIAKQTLHSCDLLLAVHLNYSAMLTLKKLKSMLWQKQQAQYAQLFELYLNSASIQSDGVYERLGKFLASNANGGEQLLTAWQEHIVAQLPVKRIGTKCYIIQTLTHILLHYDDDDGGKRSDAQLEQLFGMEPLVSMLLQELASAKQRPKKSKICKSAELQLRGICHKFEKALLNSFKHKLKQQSNKLHILRSLLQQQPQLDNVTQTPRFTQQLLGQLDEAGRTLMYEFYREQLISQAEHLGKTHREYCLNQMHQLQLEFSKRSDQLDFLLLTAVFHLDGEQQPCAGGQLAAPFSRQTASRCEEVLFSCLMHKLGSGSEQLATLNGLLRGLLQQLAKQISKPDFESKLRTKLVPDFQLVWKEISLVVNAKASAKEMTTLALVFDALILSLALAMFMPSCSIAPELVTDILICKQNALDSKPGTKKNKNNSLSESEPRWQEVLTDVLLQLLLQTGHFWRSFVNNIFGALMPHLGSGNLGQMLDNLDMTQNPLGIKDGDQEDFEDEAEDEEMEMDEDNEPASDEEQTKDEEDGDENDDDDDDEDNDDEEENADDDEYDDATNLEQIRENVRLALLNDDNDGDNDASSVDWNDVGEEQGDRLNRALETAFHAFKPKGQSKSKSKRQTKSERINSTTLLHFRIRVLDLIEQFVIARPQLEFVVDALSRVYHVYHISCTDDKLKSLSQTSVKLLQRLITIKTSGLPATKSTIVDGIEALLVVKSPKNAEHAPNESNLWRNKCIAYLFTQCDGPALSGAAIQPLLQKYLHGSLVASFGTLFATQWDGIAPIAISLSKLLLTNKLSNVRRKQYLELLLKHIRRIQNALANDSKAAKELANKLNEYQPTGSADRKLHKKLLAKLQNYT